MAELVGREISHYRILKRLGAGGMGEVYCAEDVRLGRKVALKFLRPELLHEPQARRRFEFEARAAAILNHPNVTTLFEFNSEEGFLSLEYVEGGTLEERLAEGPLPLAEAIRLALAVCRGLGHAHGRNVVHRDIKPSNILMGHDGSIKLTDFGLAKVRDTSMRTTTGVVLGTAAYMSPEQVRGVGMDRRADLFSLGVVLYRCIAGRSPWKGEGVAVLYSVLHDAQPPLLAIAVGIPPALSALVERLLRKAPTERFASAEEVESHLLDIELGLSGPALTRPATEAEAASETPPTPRPAAATPVETPAAPTTPAAPGLARGPEGADTAASIVSVRLPRALIPLIGREAELARLRAALDQAEVGTGSTILVSGEAGVGKSRLMEEFKGWAEANGILCLGGRCVFRGGRNFQPFVEALEEFARRAAMVGGRADSEMSRAHPSLGAVLPTLNVLLDPNTALAIEPRNREHLWHLLDSLLKLIARSEPLVLFLDDLQWADEGTLSLLNHVTRNIGQSRLLVVAAYRPEDLGAAEGGEHPLRDTLRLLSSADTCDQLVLAPLDGAGTLALCQAAAPDDGVSKEMALSVHRRAMGNPFFTLEIVRLLATGLGAGAASSRDAGTGAPPSMLLPQTITDVVMRRLSRVSAEERDILDLAAVEGEIFHTDTLEQGTGIPRINLLKRLRNLHQSHHLILPVEEGHRFSHGLIREVLLRGMPPELRQEYNAAVAAHLLGGYADRADYAGRIGYHLFEGGRHAEALPFLMRAGAEARRLFLNDRALEFYRHALEARDKAGPQPPVARSAILRRTCEVLLLLGRPEAARAAAQEALDEDQRSGDEAARAASLEWLGEAALAQGDYDAAEAGLNAAIDLSRRLGDVQRVARCEQKLGAVAARRADYPGALARFDSALRELRRSGNDIGVARIRLESGEVMARQGDFPAATEAFESAVETFRRMGDRHGLARGLNRLGNVAFQRGEGESALSYYEEALALAVDIGDLQGTALLQANIGNLHLTRGDAGRALEAYEAALARFREIGDHLGASQCLMALGNVHFSRGDFEAATRFYRESMSGREAMGDRWGLANAADNLGVAEYYLGRWDEALRHARSALDLRRQLGDRPGMAESALNLGNLLAVLGDPAAAGQLYEDALRTAEAIGDRGRVARALLSQVCLCLRRDDEPAAARLLQDRRLGEITDASVLARKFLFEALCRGPADRDAPLPLLHQAREAAARSGSIPDLAAIHLASARVFVYAGRREEALAAIDDALRLVAGDRLPLLELGALCLKRALLGAPPGAGLTTGPAPTATASRAQAGAPSSPADDNALARQAIEDRIQAISGSLNIHWPAELLSRPDFRRTCFPLP